VKILLTGASGNVGSRVLPEVVRRSHSVRTFATLTDHRKPALMARVEAVWGDTTDPAAVARAVECERMIRESGLTWAIFRLVDVPILDVRDPHPIMFEIGLDNRIGVLHADGAGLAIANALETPEVWGRVLFIGGGPSCQLTYREYLTRLLAAMGVQPLPEEAFSDTVLRHRLGRHRRERSASALPAAHLRRHRQSDRRQPRMAFAGDVESHQDTRHRLLSGSP
jgi:nucleoside-diphosphate-sugar epimerase